ncbi:MAG: hypothetical protein EBV06_07910 [Planctomycetia bacterium]|nr:hypothetical protein [Planctomycetia bacterium]
MMPPRLYNRLKPIKINDLPLIKSHRQEGDAIFDLSVEKSSKCSNPEQKSLFTSRAMTATNLPDKPRICLCYRVSYTEAKNQIAEPVNEWRIE